MSEPYPQDRGGGKGGKATLQALAPESILRHDKGQEEKEIP
jgi:hypothetical protein